MFALRRDETVVEGLQRVAAGCLEDAIEQLSLAGDVAAHVHETRKRLKELRALLRVARGAMPARRRRALSRRLREAGRALSAARDAEVRLATFDALYPAADGLPVAAAELRRALLRERDEDAAAAAVAAASVRRELEALLASLPGWWTGGGGWSALAPGLEWIYRRGRRAMAAAAASGEGVSFHEWRKRVKDLLYATRLLTPVWPPVQAAIEGELQRLSELLGDEHDAMVLAERLEDVPALRAGAEARSLPLRARSLALGRRLYAESPRAWLARQRALWVAWRV